jgi:hypothetical protein
MPVKFQTYQDARRHAAHHKLPDFEHRGYRYVNEPGAPFYLPKDGSSFGRPSGHIHSFEHSRQDALAHGHNSFSYLGSSYNKRAGMSDEYDPEVFDLSDDDTFEDAMSQQMPFQAIHHEKPHIQQQHPKKKKKITPMRVEATGTGNLMGAETLMSNTGLDMQLDKGPKEGLPKNGWTDQEEIQANKRTGSEKRQAGVAAFADRYLSKAEQVLLESQLLLDHMLDLVHIRLPMSQYLKDKIRGLEPTEESEDREVDPTDVVEVAEELATYLNEVNETLNQDEVDKLDTKIQNILELDEAAIIEQKLHAGQQESQQQDQGMSLTQMGQGQQQQSQQQQQQSRGQRQQIELSTPVLSTSDLQPVPSMMLQPTKPFQTEAQPKPSMMLQPTEPFQPEAQPKPQVAFPLEKHLPTFKPAAFQPITSDRTTSQPVESASQSSPTWIQPQFLNSYTADKKGALKRMIQSHNKRSVASAAEVFGVPVSVVNKQLKRERARLAGSGVKPEGLALLSPADILSTDARISPGDLHSLINQSLITTTWPVPTPSGQKSKGAKTIAHGRLLAEYASRIGVSHPELNQRITTEQRRYGGK